MDVTFTQIGKILTRSSGYLKTVCSHSLQPYRGCALGSSLCGVGCYVRHNRYVTAGRPWGSFVEVRENAAASYLEHQARERRWAERARGGFSIFLSSSTEPFQPLEFRHHITRSILEAMLQAPPDVLILQTHSHRVVEYCALYRELLEICDVRVHLSIETDRDGLPGLPSHASPIARRFAAAEQLKQVGIPVVITVSPLLPIEHPKRFFERIAEVADAVVLDHFIGGDGSSEGQRTRRTALPEGMQKIEPASVDLAYRDAMEQIARRYLPGRVGVGIDGFAGRFL